MYLYKDKYLKYKKKYINLRQLAGSNTSNINPIFSLYDELTNSCKNANNYITIIDEFSIDELNVMNILNNFVYNYNKNVDDQNKINTDNVKLFDITKNKNISNRFLNDEIVLNPNNKYCFRINKINKSGLEKIKIKSGNETVTQQYLEEDTGIVIINTDDPKKKQILSPLYQYIGEVKNNLPNGYGKMISYLYNNIIEGLFENGQILEGKIIFDNGERIYEGKFTNDKLNGYGKITTNNSIKEGIFIDNELSEGSIIGKDGAIYEGGFNRDGKLEKGKIISPYGIIMEGDFLDNQLKYGKMIFLDNTIWEGQFNNLELNGTGKIITNNSVSEGTFLNGNLAEGSIEFSNGLKKYGIFKNGEKLVEGTIINSRGLIKEGKFNKYEELSEGKVTHPDGTTFEGTFINGYLANGTIIHPNGLIEEL